MATNLEISPSMLPVMEEFYSIQGEGMYMGVPSVFLRTFGCNFFCNGLGMKRGELSQERFAIDPKDYKEIEELISELYYSSGTGDRGGNPKMGNASVI